MINIKISGRQEQSQKKNVLMKQDKALMVAPDDDEEDYEYKVFHSEYDKENILSITFLDNLDSMQEDAWDVSENRDGSVMAWVVPNEDKYDLYIGADGQIMGNRDCSELFSSYYHLKKIDFNDCFNTEMVEDMCEMFQDCQRLQEIDLSNFNTKNVTDMSGMFSGCSQITKINASRFDTSKVENMSSMFKDCASLKNLDVENFDTGNVENMSEMFKWCYALVDLNLESFDTGNVKFMQDMFKDCSKLVNLDISNFDTKYVTNMSNMFYGCEVLESFDPSKINTENVINNDYMYGRCYQLDEKVDYNVYESKDDEVCKIGGFAQYTNMYSGPDDSSEVITEIPAGAQVEVRSYSVGNYYQYAGVVYNDLFGYIKERYIINED